MAMPVISYPGAKWRFWEHIKPYIPRDIKDWREPFFGGGSMSLSIADDPDFNLERMVVGDLAPEIWALWEGIKESAPDVCEIAMNIFQKWCPTHQVMQETPNELPEYQEIEDRAVDEARKFWDWAEKVDTSQMSLPERAARTYLVNKISFSGMGDSGSMSKDRLKAFHISAMSQRILRAQPLLQKMEIKNCSFEETMADVDKNKTFIFLDPPYYKQESSGLYGRGGDTHKGFPHEHFAQFTCDTECKWFITYDDSVKVRQMFRKPIKYIEPGKIAGRCYLTPFVIPGGYTMAQRNSEDALAGEELFISNYDIEKIGEDEIAGFF